MFAVLPSEGPAPLGKRLLPWPAGVGPELLHLSLPLGHFGNQVTTVLTSATHGGPSLPTCIFELPSWNNFYTKPSEDSTGCPLEVTDAASRGRAWEDPEAKSVNLEPKLLGSVSWKFKIYRRLCCSHHTMTFKPTMFCFVFSAFRFFLKWWRVQEFRNINISLLEIAKFSTMTLWKFTVQFIDSVLRFSTNLVSELSQSCFCLIKQYQYALTPICAQGTHGCTAGAGLMLACQPGTLWLVSLFHDSTTKISLLCKSKITFILKLHSGSWT